MLNDVGRLLLIASRDPDSVLFKFPTASIKLIWLVNMLCVGRSMLTETAVNTCARII
jgi:hypothetical protein